MGRRPNNHYGDCVVGKNSMIFPRYHQLDGVRRLVGHATLERQPGADPLGFAGLQDRTDYHWGSVIKAALVSTVLGVGAELGSGNDGNLVRALRCGS